jgi:hypothetical protein
MVALPNNNSAMKIVKMLFLFLSACSMNACGQIGDHSHKEMEDMEIIKITNNIARSAIDAWQKGDSKQWLSFQDLF